MARLNGSSLDTETAFTTTALLGLVTHPANMIMTIVPQAIGSLAAYGRIQDYLLQPPRSDQRLLSRFKARDDESSEDAPAVSFQGVTVQPSSSTSPILKDVDLSISKGSTILCAGPVGSGKTTLVKCILGEIAATTGTVSVSSKQIAYCEQSPWLPSGTLRDAVCGFQRKTESAWYKKVIQLCCLDAA